MCLDQHVIPTGEEIGLKLIFFSVFDMMDGFFQIPLSKRSTDLCIFTTPYGKYKLFCLPFDLSISPGVF